MGWIKVGERLPAPEVGDVLVVMAKFGKRRPFIMGISGYDNERKKWKDEKGRDIEDNSDYFTVTHWQLLPELPGDEKPILLDTFRGAIDIKSSDGNGTHW